MTTHDREAADPIEDWASDYDIFDERYVEQPYPIWDDLRQRCPIAHSERWGGSWMPTRMEDIRAIAKDTEVFSSRQVSVTPRPERDDEFSEVRAPPIDSDPPEHLWARRLILPFFTPQAVARYEPITRDFCRSLIAGFVDSGRADAAVQYSQQIPVRIIAQMLGVPTELSDQFTHWVREILEFGLQQPERRVKATLELLEFLDQRIEQRRQQPADDIISFLLAADIDGEPVPHGHILGTCQLVMVAGVDTTWSAIGSSLWHLATHAEDRRRLAAEPELIDTAVEEFLRAYAPVTMARIVATDTEFHGCPMQEGDRVLLSWPAANRDPEEFEDADRVCIDRQRNRHLAFGLGIHRCAGSNLARMEMKVALEEWMKAIPEFELDATEPTLWAGGQVRGPRKLPVRWTR